MKNNNISEIQRVCKKIFFEFIRICEKYNLRYYPIDGTLLGAVRHQGFIPWDDDIDIAMPRLDYEKFCEIVNDELPQNMYWVSYEDSLKRSTLGEIAHLFCNDLNIEVTYGGSRKKSDMWIDVMIMYGMPDTPCRQWLHYKRISLYRGLARMGRIENIGGREHSFIERIFIWIAHRFDLSKIFNTEKILLHSVKILNKYSYDDSNFVISLPSEYGMQEIAPKINFEPYIGGEFEGKKIHLPADAESILTRIYGNYMQLPPENERKSKHNAMIL